MLRRAPTVLTITAEDVAAFEDRMERARQQAGARSLTRPVISVTPQQQQVPRHQHHHRVLPQDARPGQGGFASLPPSSSGEERDGDGVEDDGVGQYSMGDVEAAPSDEDMGDAEDDSPRQPQQPPPPHLQQQEARRRQPHQSHHELQRMQRERQTRERLARERREPEADPFANHADDMPRESLNPAITPTPAHHAGRAAAAAAAAAAAIAEGRRADAAPSALAPADQGGAALGGRVTRSREERIGLSTSSRRR